MQTTLRFSVAGSRVLAIAMITSTLLATACVSKGTTTVAQNDGGATTTDRFGDTPCGRKCSRALELGCDTESKCEVACVTTLDLAGACRSKQEALIQCIVEREKPACDPEAGNAEKIEVCEPEVRALILCQEDGELTCDLPADPSNECLTCIAGKCCSPQAKCSVITACSNAIDTWIDCATAATTNSGVKQCGATFAGTSPEARAYVQCVQKDCSVCGL